MISEDETQAPKCRWDPFFFLFPSDTKVKKKGGEFFLCVVVAEVEGVVSNRLPTHCGVCVVKSSFIHLLFCSVFAHWKNKFSSLTGR